MLIPIYFSLAKLGDWSPFVKRLLGLAIPWVPHPALREMKVIADTLDHTSREIYAQKKQALMSGNEDVKQGIEEGRDLMSVLRKSQDKLTNLN